MIPDECQYCGGKLHEGTTEITAKVNNTVIVIKNIPAFVCENCDEAYYSLETARKIDEVRKAFRAGILLVKPLAAGEVDLNTLGICPASIG
jgi:YgiT-type zinc finger domain-containing protein